MARTHAPGLSPREIQKRTGAIARQASRSVTLFYGSLEDHDMIKVMVFGTYYRLFSSGLHDNPQDGSEFKGDGVLVIPDQMGQAEEGRAAALKPGGAKRVIFSADQIGSKLIELLQARGVAQLTGDDAEDAQIKRQATATWIEWRRTSASRMVGQHYINNARASSSPALSHLVEDMNDLQIAAQRFMERDQSGEYDQYFKARARYKFKCREKDCGRGENDAEAFALHLRSWHKLSDDEIEERYADDDGEQPAAAKVKKAAGRPRAK